MPRVFKTFFVVATFLMFMQACKSAVYGASSATAAVPIKQDAKATGAGAPAINAGRDVIINYRDPEVQRLLRLLEQQSDDARRREQKADERIGQLERENQRLKDEQAKAIAGVLQAAREPNPSPAATAASKALQGGDGRPTEQFYRDQELLAAKAGREKLREAAEAARRQGSLALLHDVRYALDAFRRATDYEPDDPWNWFQLGNLQRLDGNTDAAKRSYERGTRAVEERIASDLNNIEWQRDLSVSHEKIGNMQAAQGETAAALASYRRGLGITEKLAGRDLNNVTWQTDLVLSIFKVTSLVPPVPPREAEALLERGIAILKTLNGQNKLLPNQLGWERQLSDRLRKLRGH